VVGALVVGVVRPASALVEVAAEVVCPAVALVRVAASALEAAVLAVAALGVVLSG
jgi:hypothetical protein